MKYVIKDFLTDIFLITRQKYEIFFETNIELPAFAVL